MKPVFRILTGNQAGRAFTPARKEFIAGRHTDADLRFDAAQDLSVSARHARVFRRDGRWHVEDLSSLNGTFVNGQQVRGAVELAQGDRIEFGAGGPLAEVSFENDGESTTQRVRARVQRETRKFRWIAGGVIVVLLGVLAAELAVDRRELTSWAQERDQLQQRIDSLLSIGGQATPALDVEVAGLRAALEQSEARLRELRAQIGRTSDAGDDAEALKHQLLSTTAALRRQQLAANLDFASIQRRSRGAVAMLWVEYNDGTRATGTAFAVRPDGLLLTNRHLVTGADGQRRVRRAAVRFADSDQAFPVRVLGVSRADDLAAAQVENVEGTVPSIAVSRDPPDNLKGAPVALIGFPYGGEPDREPVSGTVVARPVVSAGLVMRADEDRLEIQGVGAAGASGSPILDANGALVGILFGGRDESGVHVLLAVPAHAAAAFLDSVL